MAPCMRYSWTTWVLTTEDNHTQNTLAENDLIQAHTQTNPVMQVNIASNHIDGMESIKKPPSKFLTISGQVCLNLLSREKAYPRTPRY
jgi:hypothetical protein